MKTTITTLALVAVPNTALAHGGHTAGIHSHGYALAGCLALALGVFLFAYLTDRRDRSNGGGR